MATIAVSQGERGIVARPTTDRALLREFLEQDRLYAAYALCDLDDREYPRTRWAAAYDRGDVVAIGMEYSGLTPQPLFLMGGNDGIATILRDVLRPRAAYVAAKTQAMPAVETQYRVDPGPQMVRMWVDRARFRPYPAEVRRLLPSEIGELNRLYQLGFASWLPSSAIAEGVYFGVRVHGKLISAAGTHVISREARLAVVGNVLTHADYRGRGYATTLVAEQSRWLLDAGRRFCFLYTDLDNPTSNALYRRIGYRMIAESGEVRFDPKAAA